MELLFELLPDLPRDSLRLVSHTLKNLTDEGGADALEQLGRVLPILSAEMKLQTGASPLEVSTELHRTLRFLPVSKICQALTSSEHTYGAVLIGLISKNSALREMTGLPQGEGRNRAFSSSEFLELFGAPDAPPSLRAMWELDNDSTRALRVLSDFEEFWRKDRLQELELSQRSIRFELSVVEHLHEHGFLPAVRAALAFGGRPEFVHELDIFRNDTSLRQLAEALLRMRFRVLDHIRGLLPLHGLTSWADYLRGPCTELAESRGITKKEAMSFAHFALHLMNMCDLINELGVQTHDAIRRTVSDVEDSLKEFASMRTAEDPQSGTALERAIDPWGPRVDLHRLADRLARLNGFWSLGGSSKGLVGMGRLDLEVCNPYIAALNLLSRSDSERLAHVLRYGRFSSDFAGWRPECLVSFLATLGRALPETSRPLTLNLQEVSLALKTCPGLGQLFLYETDSFLRVENEGDRITVHLELDSELRALLELTSSTDPQVLKVIKGRIQAILGVPTRPQVLDAATA